MERQSDKQKERQMVRQRDRQKERQIVRQRNRQKERQMVRQSDIQKERETYGETNRQEETDIKMLLIWFLNQLTLSCVYKIEYFKTVLSVAPRPTKNSLSGQSGEVQSGEVQSGEVLCGEVQSGVQKGPARVQKRNFFSSRVIVRRNSRQRLSGTLRPSAASSACTLYRRHMEGTVAHASRNT